MSTWRGIDLPAILTPRKKGHRGDHPHQTRRRGKGQEVGLAESKLPLHHVHRPDARR